MRRLAQQKIQKEEKKRRNSKVCFAKDQNKTNGKKK
jgi:hypothetical protein